MLHSRWLVRIGARTVLGLGIGALGSTLAAQTLLDLPGFRSDSLGCALQAAGDFDFDGFPDVLVGAHQATKGMGRPGDVDGSVGILSGRDARVLFRVTGEDYAARTGRPAGKYFGADVAMVGDLDLDGVCDVLVAHGNPKVLRFIAAFSGSTGAFLFEISDPHGNTDFGDPMVALGDLVDSQGNPGPDGVFDFAVGAPVNTLFQGTPNYPGRVYVYSGASPASGPVITLNGVFPQVAFGMAVTPVGDLDGDGLPALAVGAPGGSYVEVFDGPGLAPVLFLNLPQPLPTYGYTLAHLGDLDGDGRSELAVGVPGASGGGRVLVYTLDLAGASLHTRLQAANAPPGLLFGSGLAGLPIDPLTGRGLLDLDHDGQPDPFFDWNRDGTGDFVVAAQNVASPDGAVGAGGVYLVRGTGAALELASAPIQQGVRGPFEHAYLPNRTPHAEEWFGWRLTLLGNAFGESQARLAIGTPRDEANDGALAVLRPAFAHFGDDTFSRVNDGVGTSRQLELDFGPRYAGRRYHLLGTTGGTNPGQIVQGFRVPLNDDGPGGLWERTTTLQAAGTPLAFSQLAGRLDATGRATVVVTVTAPTAGHPWFDVVRHHYLAVLTKPGMPGELALVGAPTALHIE